MAKQSLCLIEGCGKPNKARGFCNLHYQRLLKHGDPLGGGTSIGEPQRFFEEIAQYNGDECLAWPFAHNKNGYGRMRVDGKMVYVTRRLCEEVNGPPPTPKHEAAHSCGNGHEGCVTKRHLEWKTPSENQADKLTHGTHNRGERQGASKLTETQAREILAFKGKETQRSIAERFGVSRTAVSQIHCGRNWNWMDVTCP